MIDSELKFKSWVVGPGQEIRQEGKIPKVPFGKGSETPISAIVKELHIHQIEGKTHATLDSPILGGPVVALHSGEQTILIPGEQVVFETLDVIFIAKKGLHFHYIFLENQD